MKRKRWRDLSPDELDLAVRADYAALRGFYEEVEAPGLRVGRYFAQRIYRTRFYNVLTLAADGDVEVRTVAVRRVRRQGVSLAKEVSRASADRPDVLIRDMVYVNMGGYAVDWSAEGVGKPKSWFYGNERGQWLSAPYTPRGKWVLDCPTVNPEAILGSGRFRHCAWKPECGPPLRYLKAWAANPRIETLAKAGLERLALKRGLTERIRSNGQFRRFFFERTAEIREGGYSAETIFRAFRDRRGLSESAERIGAEKLFRRHGEKLHGEKAERALDYVRRTKGATVQEYCDYLADCRRLGMDAADTKVAYPRDFHARQAEARARCRALDRKADRKRREAMRRALAREKAAWEALEKVEAYGVTARLPRSEADLRREGKALKHCVWTGNYAERIAAGTSLVVFLRRAGAEKRPYATAEISPDGAEVRQCHGKSHSRPDDDTIAFAEGPLLKAVRRIARKRRKTAAGAAVDSEQ